MTIRAQVAGRLIQAGARRMIQVPSALQFPDVRMAAVRPQRIPTEAGEVRATVYRPTTLPPGRAPAIYVNFHGGGYVIRCAEQDDALCRYIAHHAGCVVLNVDYDVAPQRPFPTAPLQAYGACEWVTTHGDELGWDGERLAVGGQSAGGALAAAVCRIARDRAAFTPKLQVVAYAPLDLTIEPGRKQAKARKPLITPGISRIFNEAYTPDPATRSHPWVSPAAHNDHSGLPPALVITAELDTLCEEGDRFAAALRHAGVPVTHRVFAGVDHAFTHQEPASSAIEAYELITVTVKNAVS